MRGVQGSIPAASNATAGLLAKVRACPIWESEKWRTQSEE